MKLLKLAFSIVSFALSGLAAAQTQWDLPSGYPAGNFHTENLARFADDVDKLSSGKLKITVHPNGSLFKAPEIKRAVQGGLAPIGEILLVNHQNEWPIFGADGIPFLADSYGEAMKLYKTQKPLLDQKLGEQGMLLLFAVPWAPQGIYSRKELHSVADMKGLKWRAYSLATARIAELVGAQPVTLPSAELSQAMASGAVDAYMSSGATGYDTKTYEHLKNWYDTQAWLPKNAVIVNKSAFNALDKSLQEAVLAAAAQAESRGWSASAKANIDAQEKLKANGMTVHTPSPTLMDDLKKVGDTLLREWLKKAGPEGQQLVDAYRKLQ